MTGEAPRPRRNRTSPDRVQRSFYLPRELVDRARAAVWATQAEVRRLEETYNDGKPFPPVASVPSGPSPAGVERIRNGVRVPRRVDHPGGRSPEPRGRAGG